MNRFSSFIREVRAEMGKVSWPTTRQTTIYSVIVLIISGILMLYLGFLDFVFRYILERFIL